MTGRAGAGPALRRPAVVAALMAMALAAACVPGSGANEAATPGGSASAGRPTVVVTTTVLGDVVRDVVGGTGRVEVLMAPGQDPHGFTLSAQQAQALRQADLVVATGAGLEEGMLDALDAAEREGVEVVRVASALADGGGGTADPHIWLDPVRFAEAPRVIADRLAAATRAGAESEWDERGRTVADRIRATHEEVERIVATVPERCRVLVTDHDAFGAFADRYGFEVVGTVIPGTSTAADPSARDFAELADVIAERDVPAIFVEAGASDRLAEALAREVDPAVDVVQLFTGSLGPPGSGAGTYAGMLTTDARRIADALAAC